MASSAAIVEPSGHTPDGGVLVGSEGARRRLVLFEDLSAPIAGGSRRYRATSCFA